MTGGNPGRGHGVWVSTEAPVESPPGRLRCGRPIRRL